MTEKPCPCGATVFGQPATVHECGCTVTATTAVFVDDGGWENPRNGYDEQRVWYVTPGDDDGEPTGDHETHYSFDAAFAAAEKMAARYGGVEVVTA